MNLLVVLLIVLLLVGVPSGIHVAGATGGISVFALLLIIVLVLALTGRL